MEEPLSEGEGEEKGIVVHRCGRVHQQTVAHVAEVADSLQKDKLVIMNPKSKPELLILEEDLSPSPSPPPSPPSQSDCQQSPGH